MNRLYPPPTPGADWASYSRRLARWREVADSIPRVAELTAALGGGTAARSVARRMEAAIQCRDWGYLRRLNTSSTTAAFRVLFPELPRRCSVAAVARVLHAEMGAK